MCDGLQVGATRTSGTEQTNNTKKAYGVVGKGNGECWLMEEKHTALTVGGGQPGQGYPCVLAPKTTNNATLTGEQSATLGVNCGMTTGRNGVLVKAIGFDVYNQTATGGYRKQ